MHLQCPNCKFEADILDEKVPEGKASVSCPKCKHKFILAASTKQAPFACPKCQAEQQVSDVCTKCGIIFSKYNPVRATNHRDIVDIQTCNKAIKTKTKGHINKWITASIAIFAVTCIVSLFSRDYVGDKDVPQVSTNSNNFKSTVIDKINQQLLEEDSMFKRGMRDGSFYFNHHIVVDDINMTIKTYKPVDKEINGIKTKVTPIRVAGKASCKMVGKLDIFDKSEKPYFRCYDNIDYNEFIFYAYKDEIDRDQLYLGEIGSVTLGEYKECEAEAFAPQPAR